jgi:hypothetical protein
VGPPSALSLALEAGHDARVLELLAVELKALLAEGPDG